MSYITSLQALLACDQGRDITTRRVAAFFTGGNSGSPLSGPRRTAIDMRNILDTCGVADCIWCLRTVPDGEKIAAEFIRHCTEMTGIRWRIKLNLHDAETRSCIDLLKCCHDYLSSGLELTQKRHDTVTVAWVAQKMSEKLATLAGASEIETERQTAIMCNLLEEK